MTVYSGPTDEMKAACSYCREEREVIRRTDDTFWHLVARGGSDIPVYEVGPNCNTEPCAAGKIWKGELERMGWWV